MKVNLQKFDKFINSPKLSGSIFLVCGAYKTYKDYQNAEPSHKKRFLIKDSVVLSGAALGMLFHSTLANQVVKIKFFDKLSSKMSDYISTKKNIEKPAMYAKEISKNILSNFLSFSSGIIGALGADWLLSKTGFEQPVQQEKVSKTNLEKFAERSSNKNLNIIDPHTKQIMYSRVTDMPQMKIFTTGMIGAQAIDLSKEKELDKRLKYATNCLISNSLVPLFFLSVSSAFTNNLKTKYRIPIIFGSLVGGTMCVNKLVESYNKKR